MERTLILILIIATRVASFLIRGVKGTLAPIFRMKRALTLIAIIAACMVGFLSIRGVMPFMSVFGTSMEPELQAGNLILLEEVAPADVEVGDIIVFTIPSAVREYYNYPPVVAHRVLEVRTSERGVTFRTKGDNTGEDPFTVRPQDIRGMVSKQIPYLGFPLLFFQSQQGLIFIIVALSLLALFLYADELSRGRRRVHEGLFAPVIEENRRSSQVMAQTMQSTEKRMERTEQTIDKFASAIEVYAQHLQSHTSAIQGLSEASQELKKGAAEQNKVLIHLMEVMELGVPQKKEIEPKVEEVKPEVEEVQFPPGCARSRPKPAKEDEIFRAG